MGVDIYGKMMSVNEAVQFLDDLRKKSVGEEEKEIAIDEDFIDGIWHEVPLGTYRHLLSAKESYERIIDFVPVEVQHEIHNLWRFTFPSLVDRGDLELPTRNEFLAIGVGGWLLSLPTYGPSTWKSYTVSLSTMRWS